MRFNPVNMKAPFVTNISRSLWNPPEEEKQITLKRNRLLQGQPVSTHYPQKQIPYHASSTPALQSRACVSVPAAAQHALKLNYRPFSQSFPEEQRQTAGDIWLQASIFAAISLSCWGIAFSLSWQQWWVDYLYLFPVTNLQNRMAWARWPPHHEVDIHMTDWERKEKNMMVERKRSVHLVRMHPWHC